VPNNFEHQVSSFKVDIEEIKRIKKIEESSNQKTQSNTKLYPVWKFRKIKMIMRNQNHLFPLIGRTP
jgi:hypothetical protein